MRNLTSAWPTVARTVLAIKKASPQVSSHGFAAEDLVSWFPKAQRQQRFDLLGGGHSRRAFEARSDDRPGGVGEAENMLEGPTLQEPVADGAAEAVSGAEPVDDLNGMGRDMRFCVRGHSKHPFGAHLHDCQLDAGIEQGVSSFVRIANPYRRFALFEIPDRHRYVGQHSAHLPACSLTIRPEHGPVIKIEGGRMGPAPRLERHMVGGTAGLGRTTGDCDPEQGL